MIEVGKWNKLSVIKEVPFGVYLNGGNVGEILLPKKVVPENTQINDLVDVFVYFDSEDKIIATTKQPRATVGDFAFLRVVDVNLVGVFLDWGLDKDLLVPRTEQQRVMEKGKSYIVYVKQDNQGRIVASSKLNYFLDKTTHQYKIGQEVDLLIEEPSPLGIKVIVNNSHWGLIHSGDIFQQLNCGQKLKGYIKTIREDGKLDVVLRKMGPDRFQDLAAIILNKLQDEGGFLALHDKSPSQDIKRIFGESKSSFKNAIGNLYRQGKIQIETDGIRLKSKKK